MRLFRRRKSCDHTPVVVDLDRERGGVWKNGYKELRCTKCGFVLRRWQDW